MSTFKSRKQSPTEELRHGDLDRRMLLCGGLSAIITSLLACGNAEEGKESARNNPSRKPETSRLRLVSLFPPITETIYELGLQALLVGRSSYCSLPKEAERLTPMGTALTPNLEAIAGIQPDLILADDSIGTNLQRLTAIAKVESFPWLSMEEIIASITRLGTILGHQEKADALSLRYDKAFMQVPVPDAPTMLLALGSDNLGTGPIWYMKSNSIHGRAILAAGFQNAIAEPVSGPPSLPLEKLIATDPDIILILVSEQSSDAEAQAMVESLNRLTPLKAVQKRRIGVLRGDGFLSTGPAVLGLPQAIRTEGAGLMKP
jgi:ABC-type Fe3+-hydroxamate transport system substrate-binding protein